MTSRRLHALAPWLIALLLAWLSATPVLAQDTLAGPKRTERIEAELVPMTAWATPGSTLVVAVRQAIEPGWHTYWRNPGDSGGATTLAWTLPAGVEAGGIVWPVPERQRLSTLMNYGYSGQVFLPVPIQVPADAVAGSTLTLVARALFLVCSDEMCVPDELTLRLDLPVRDGEAPLDPRFGEAIQTTLEAAPRPAGIEARVTLDGQTLRLTATGGPLIGLEPRRAWFFPDTGGLIDHPAPQPGRVGPDGLALDLAIGGQIRAAGLTGPVSGVLATDDGAWEIVAMPGPPLAGAGAGGGRALDLSEGDGDQAGPVDWAVVAQSLVFALLGGLILNLMPCVFPILAMKASSLARSAHDAAEARRDGLAFTLGVLVTFAVLAGLLLALRAGGEAIGWGFQLQSPGVIAVLALLMLAIGLNLSGVFDVGAGLQASAATGPLSRLHGRAGAFSTGVLAVVVAAPCTAPFMAFALGAALVMPAPLALAVFLALGLGLALPYLMVSLSPRLLSRLPRPGPWMDRLKGLLAFPMYGTALWLLWVLSRQIGAEGLALFLGAILLLAFAAWLWGRAQTDRAGGRPAMATTVIAAVSLAGTAALTWGTVTASPPHAAEASETALPSQPWSEAAVTEALGQGRPVLVNFTADWCVTCKINERTSLSSTRVAEALARTDTLYLVGDWTRRDDAITRELERRERSGVPLYMLFRPGETEPRILPQLLTEGMVLDALRS